MLLEAPGCTGKAKGIHGWSGCHSTKGRNNRSGETARQGATALSLSQGVSDGGAGGGRAAHVAAGMGVEGCALYILCSQVVAAICIDAFLRCA